MLQPNQNQSPRDFRAAEFGFRGEFLERLRIVISAGSKQYMCKRCLKQTVKL